MLSHENGKELKNKNNNSKHELFSEPCTTILKTKQNKKHSKTKWEQNKTINLQCIIQSTIFCAKQNKNNNQP